jgi:excisionase family DNA binding protein
MNGSIVGVVGQGGSTSGVRLLLTPNEAARSLSICPRTLWTLTHEGQIPFVRIGRLVRYSPGDLQAWIEKQKQQAPVGNVT